MRTLVAVALAALLAACGGGEDMPVPKPCAMWPLTIVAGTNDAIDVDVDDSGLTAHHATIAAGTYYSPPGLAEAVRAALAAAVTPEATFLIVAGVNDALAWAENGAPFTATTPPGRYTLAGLMAAVSGRMLAATGHDYGPSLVAGKATFTVSGGPTWKPIVAGPTTFGVLGWSSTPASEGAAQTANAAVTAPGAAAWAVSVGPSGRFTITTGAGQDFILRFATGTNAATSARDVLGFGVLDTTKAESTSAPFQAQGCWFPEEAVQDDTGDLDVFERTQAVALAGNVKSLDFAPIPRIARTVKFQMVPAYKWSIADEGADHAGEAFQRLLRSGWARFRWFPDATDLSTGSDYVLDIETAKAQERNRLSPGMPLYGLTLKLRKYV